MPTARELLEEVDALMRRNRTAPETAPTPEAFAAAAEAFAATPVDDIPVLTEVAPEDETVPDTPLEDVPLLTDMVDLAEIDLATSAYGGEALQVDDEHAAPALTSEATAPREHDGPPAVATVAAPLPEGDASPSLATVSAPLLDDGAPVSFSTAAAPLHDDERALIGGLPAEAFGVVAASLAANTTARPQEQSRLPHDDPRWTTLAEDIRMQVLQRVDLFTETGLGARLQPQLQPIVERASAELVATINAQVGQLLRAYVAEAIEREIEKWREDAR